MTTSGITSYEPTGGELVLQAFARCGIRRSALTTEQLEDGLFEANLLQSEFANKQPNLWRSELYSQTLTATTATYTLPVRFVKVQTAFVSTTVNSTTTDRVIAAMDATMYASLPSKTQEGQPTSYWIDRQITPTITLWPVPDDATTYTLKLRMLSHQQDVQIKSGVTVNIPYRWLDAFVSGLAARLALIHAPAKFAMLGPLAERAWTIAATEDQDHVPLKLAPMMAGYFR